MPTDAAAGRRASSNVSRETDDTTQQKKQEHRNVTGARRAHPTPIYNIRIMEADTIEQLYNDVLQAQANPLPLTMRGLDVREVLPQHRPNFNADPEFHRTHAGSKTLYIRHRGLRANRSGHPFSPDVVYAYVGVWSPCYVEMTLADSPGDVFWYRWGDSEADPYVDV